MTIARAALALNVCVAGCLPIGCLAQSYPAKPIRLVVPFPPGGATDVLARILAAQWTDGLGQAVIVDNRAGASGAIATEFVARAPADGYTLIMATASTQAINPAVAKVPFDPVRDFTAVGIVGTSPLALVVHPSVPARNVGELIALARKTPGKLEMASFGAGTVSHLAGELFNATNGTSMLHVPYKGGPPAMADLIAGHVSVYFDTLSNTLQPAKAGRIRILAVTSAQRNDAVPDVPTVSEAGVPGYAVLTWFGIFGPAKLPLDVVARMNAEIARSIGRVEVGAKLRSIGLDPLSAPPEVLGEALRRDYATWSKLVRERGLRTD
jgi:tripartite-type tricarboxylate transporter receptor subunit TctC